MSEPKPTTKALRTPEWKEWQRDQQEQDEDLERNNTSVDFLSNLDDETRTALGHPPKSPSKETI